MKGLNPLQLHGGCLCLRNMVQFALVKKYTHISSMLWLKLKPVVSSGNKWWNAQDTM